jgi:hypothetical protein
VPFDQCQGFFLYCSHMFIVQLVAIPYARFRSKSIEEWPRGRVDNYFRGPAKYFFLFVSMMREQNEPRDHKIFRLQFIPRSYLKYWRFPKAHLTIL